jgi:hypothetical protein
MLCYYIVSGKRTDDTNEGAGTMNQYTVNGETITAESKQEAARRWAEAEYQWPVARTTAKAVGQGWYTVHYTNVGTSTIHVDRIPRGVTIR